MKTTLGIVTLWLTLGGVLGACGGDDGRRSEDASGSADSVRTAVTNSSDAAPEAERTNARSSRNRVAVKVMNSRYGRVLFDGQGRALYLFTRDRTRRTRCYGECASAWPPFVTTGTPRGRSGVKSRLLGTTRRRDGKAQVTYGGHPLYYYVGDRSPGQVLCQDVDEFGGTWLVVSPSGRAVR
jgi:predicted lipoprotein with Yx(FWY)xxD motif